MVDGQYHGGLRVEVFQSARGDRNAGQGQEALGNGTAHLPAGASRDKQRGEESEREQQAEGNVTAQREQRAAHGAQAAPQLGRCAGEHQPRELQPYRVRLD